MIVEWLKDILAWPDLTSPPVSTILFWAVLAVLAGLEAWIPAFEAPPRRAPRWETNLGLGLINGSLAAVQPISAVAAAQWASTNGVGLLSKVDLPNWLAGIASVALYSLAVYSLHVAMHKVPLLWRIHRVHHVDPHLDATTGLRSHPLEFILGAAFLAGVTIAFGLSPWALIAYEAVHAIMILVTHSNLRLPASIDRVVRLLFVTPNMHCLHHSAYQPETDSNYGGVLSIWDRLFGTYRSKPRTTFDQMQFGLEEVRDERATALWWQIKSPILSIPRATPPHEPSPVENFGAQRSISGERLNHT